MKPRSTRDTLTGRRRRRNFSSGVHMMASTIAWTIFVAGFGLRLRRPTRLFRNLRDQQSRQDRRVRRVNKERLAISRSEWLATHAQTAARSTARIMSGCSTPMRFEAREAQTVDFNNKGARGALL
jgi:hypothetical protein